MAYKEATYDEYVKAKQFAKFRYKFGVYIQLVALLFLLLLTFYTINNVEEMKTHPIKYVQDKFDVVCFNDELSYQEFDNDINIELLEDIGK